MKDDTLSKIYSNTIPIKVAKQLSEKDKSGKRLKLSQLLDKCVQDKRRATLEHYRMG